MEALAIVFVAAVSAIIFVATWIGVRSDAGRNPLTARAHLEAYREALKQKARRAQLERWDEAMVSRIDHELADVELRLASIDRQQT